MEDRIMYMELRELFEQMNPQQVKETIDRVYLNKLKSPDELKRAADEAISELMYRVVSCYPSEVSGVCSENLTELADRIVDYASAEAIEKAYEVINQ